MPTSISLGPITIYFYGLVVGFAVVAVWLVIRQWGKLYDRKVRNKDQLAKSAQKTQNSSRENHGFVSDILEQSLLWILIPGFIFARLWHVMTDWQIYIAQPLAVTAIWQGGMSIIGGIVGGLAGWSFFYRYRKHAECSWWLLPDLLALSVPIGQIIGRLGNWINQELYGLPTNLPWGITIDAQNRLPGYELQASYRPLFLYEMIGMTLFVVSVWAVARKKPTLIGSGYFTLAYLAYYSIFRILLDFLRIDTTNDVFRLGELSLGLNQLILALVCVLAVIEMVARVKMQRKKK